MVSRTAIIEMLARHRAKGDEEKRKDLVRTLSRLSTGLLKQFLDESQLKELEEKGTEEP